MKMVEIVPAILHKTFDRIETDWNLMREVAMHIQIDMTDGVFAGDGSFLDIRQLKKLTKSEKVELHLMVHTPANFVDDVIDLNPARCVFHLEAFSGTNDIIFVYEKLREATTSELALAVNPETPHERLEEYLTLIDYVLFMGYNPGWAGQLINPAVYQKIGQFKRKHAEVPVAVDGHVDKETVMPYVKAGANILCANTSIFNQGSPQESYEQLKLLAEVAAEI